MSSVLEKSPRLVRGAYSYKQGFRWSLIAGFIKNHESIIIIIMPQYTLLNISTISISPFIVINCLYERPTSCRLRLMVHSSQCTVHSAQFTVHSSQCTVHSSQCTVHCELCTVHSAQFTVHSAQCTVHSAQCTVHSAQCTVHNTQE